MGALSLVAEEFRALLASGNRLPLPVPGLMAYLEEYPRSQPSGAEDFFYWSTVDFGGRREITQGCQPASV